MMHQPISQVSLSSTSSVISAEKSTQQLQAEKAERDERYAALVARKEALEKRLKEKNDELKRFCVQEAELTGSLPLETPLEPGETPPAFRRRVGTAFTIPQCLFDKLKSDEEQTLAALELEYKILSQITCAAMRMASDVSLKRSVRRQRRIEYQQNSKRLTELEMRLNEARKQQALKLRKKPRPASDTVESSADKEPSEGGFGGTSTLTKSVAMNGGRSYSASDRPPSSSSSTSLSHTHQNHMHESHKQQPDKQLHATLSAPHHYLKAGSPDFRSHRQQLQRLGSGGYFTHHHAHYQHQSYSSSPTNYPTLSGAPLDLEKLSRHDTAFIMSPSWSPFAPHDAHYLHRHSHTARPAASQNFLELDENEPLDGSPVRRPSLESRSSRWKGNRFGSLDRKKKMAQSSPCLDSRSVEGLDVMQPESLDVPDRANFIVPTSRAAHKISSTKRAETKQLQQQQHNHLLPPPPPVHHRHRSGSSPHKEYLTPPPQPKIKEPMREPPLPPSEALLPGQTYPEHSYGLTNLIRTQSLGAVSTASSAKSAETRSIKDMYPSTSYTQQLPPKRQPPPVPPEKPPSRRPSGHSVFESKEASLSGSFSSLHLSNGLHSPQGSIHSQSKVEGQDTFEMAVPYESPKHHMVVQAGKWQPYWEETKPFEMSDFYKYSTKFRNKQPKQADVPSKQQPLHLRVDDEAAAITLPKVMPSPTPSMSPQQKGVYQPLQPMTCQPVDPNKAITPELPAKQGKVMSPNLSLNLSNGGESLADAFSTEMLAWYQDKSVPRSATLV
ncbi:serine/arginine repetitive matrix protein 1 isoform X1 [Neocloeon triangulifer]|uniref:serine/arginine repetitive matrix protein 1 isoform X1 n=1 Tax=Neocloeon triangulifer TaxID=2078957 RepID=UPI00286F0572|nr:serine/arginine repetitive matrix protein 1 isoform X1 [Neocloeon triangulifer]